MKVKESLNVIFNESPPPTKLSPLVDDDVGEEEAIKRNTKVVNNNNKDESIEDDEIINIKESKNHPLDQVIGNLNQRTLRSQAQNYSNFFCIISLIEPKDVKEALKDESWVVAMQEELNQFIANDVWELVWCYVYSLADLENFHPLMHLILIRLISIAHQRSARSIIERLVVDAMTYFLWSERNNRLFKNSKRSPEELRDLIMTTVRLKLLS
ncbi:hypothetical protein Tco_0901297 [Tanacetum coccineum]